ncbi:MAG: DUF1775 domain-containing protein [Acidimicrobiia bacterium]
MHISRLLAAAGVTASVVVATAVPAFAHAEFAGTTRLPSGTSQRLTLDVPEEKGDAVRTTVVRVQVATGWDATACESPAGWTCSITPDASGRAIVGFNRAAGTDPVERFFFTVTVGPVGRVTFPVNQTYDNGDIVRWIGAAGSAEPAPVLEAIAGPPTTAPVTAPPTTTPPATNPPATAAPATPAPTTAAPVTAPTTAVSATTAAPTTTASATSAAVTGASTTAHGATGASTTPTVEATATGAAGTNDGGDSDGGNGAVIAVVVVVLIAAAGAGAYFAKIRKAR